MRYYFNYRAIRLVRFILFNYQMKKKWLSINDIMKYFFGKFYKPKEYKSDLFN